MAGPVEVATDRVSPSGTYSPSQISLFGIEYKDSPTTVGNGANSVDLTCSTSGAWQPAIIYGYAYQGHVYTLAEPSILLVEKSKGKKVTGEGQGGFGSQYTVWIVDKLERTAQIGLSNDSFEELVLKKNIGEARAPIAYHAMFTVSHRGGKLME